MNILEEFSGSSDNDDIEDIEENYYIGGTNDAVCKNEKIIIEKDSESIYTLSKKIEIQNNKKIQFIKQMFNYLLKNFTFTESLIIHSIYNHNVKCFLIRNKTFKEYVLILNILDHLYIKFTKNILENIFDNIPINETSKKFIKLNNEINNTFDFTAFKEKYSFEDKNIKYIPKQIKYYINGFLFYLKNIVLLQHNQKILMKTYNLTKEDIDSVKDILIKDINNSFCNDDNIKIISKWMTNIIKNLMVFNVYCIKNNQPNTINIKKSFDTQIQILINLFIYLIILYNSPMMLMKENFDKKKIEIFLSFNYRDQSVIKEFIKNKNLTIILKYLYEHKLKKNIFSSRKFIRIIYKHLI